jgi:hypothetical protein
MGETMFPPCAPFFDSGAHTERAHPESAVSGRATGDSARRDRKIQAEEI